MLTLVGEFVNVLKEDRELSRRGHEELSAALKRVERIEARFDTLAKSLEAMMSRGFTGVFYPSGMVPAIQPAVPAQISTKHPTPPAPDIPAVKMRKPRVVVLNVESGHEKNGIKDGTDGRVAVVQFQDGSGEKVQNFAGFDHIICTKRTPTAWVTLAKASEWKDKIRVVPGNVRSHIVPYINALPEIEVKE